MPKIETNQSPLRKSGRSRIVVRSILLLFLLTLAFFQPGLWVVSAITAFVIAFKKASSSRFTWALVAAGAYMSAYALVAVFALPLIHAYLVAAWLWVPVWGACLLAVIFSLVFIVWGRSRDWQRGGKIAFHSITWSAAAGIALFSWMAANNKDMVEWSMAEAVSMQTINKLPNSDLSNFRLLPRARASDYFSTSNDDKTLFVSRPNMTPCDSSGKPCWQAAFHLKDRESGIWYNLLFDTVFHVATVDPTNINKNSVKTEGLDGFFLAGPNSWVVKAAFAVHNLFSQQEEALYWKSADGTMIMLIPYVSYRPTVSGVMVPYLAGVMSVNRFGLINDMSPETAKENYPGVPFYPTHLARLYAEKVAKWNGGIWGRTVSKRDELKVSEPDAADNQHFNMAPYVEVFEDIGWQEVIALEPNSESSKALASLLFFDAATGRCRQYIVPSEPSLSGPDQASGNSKQGNWQADWSGHMKVEPRPLIRNGHLYYAVGILDTVRNEHPYLGSIIIDAADMKPYPVLSHSDLVSLIEKLERGIAVQPMKLPAIAAPG
ncbi:MAG: hypothetical protein C0469_02140 [Cyanobacteria bacterium DS2.3.42]|nr:hypothetical protein [Cyanobacteria bacterium DS2.3.42]